MILEYDGKSQTPAEWSRDTGIAAGTIRKRIAAGWSSEQALTTPLCTRGRKKAVQGTEPTAYRDLERMMLGMQAELQRSIVALAEAQAQAGKALEKAERNLRSQTESIMRLGLDSIGPGVVPNSAKIVEHRAFPVAED